MLREIHNPRLFLPKSLQASFPSHLHIDIRKRAQVTEMIIMVSLMLNRPFNIRDKVMVLE